MSKNKPPSSLWYQIAAEATEDIYRLHWPIRRFCLSLQKIEKEILRSLLEESARRELAAFHNQVHMERKAAGGTHLTDDALLANSVVLRHLYKRRRESEALLNVLTREMEQRAPKTLKGAKPC